MQKRTLVALVSLICLSILLSPCAAAVDGEGTLQIEAQTVSVDQKEAEQTVSVNISISNNPGIWGMTADVYYDEELTLIEVSTGKILNCLIPDPEDPAAPSLDVIPFRLSGEASNLTDVTTNGTVLTMKFSVPEGYHEKYDITLSVVEVISVTEGDVPYEVVNGGIIVNKFVTVSYDIGDGSKPAPASSFIREGSSIKLPSYSGTVDGYTFGGWNDGENDYAAGSNYTVGDEDVTLTAIWNKVDVTGVTISVKKLDLYVDDKANLSATVAPKNALVKTVSWSSDDEDIATVDSNGEVTAISAGTANIIATSNDEDVTVYASIPVTVKNVPVSSITLNVTKLSLPTGDGYDLEATVLPDNAFNKKVIWSSSKPAVATVDENGHVTAISKGSANIIATADDGSKKSAKCAVTVTPVPVSSVEFDSENPTILALNGTCTLAYTVNPDTAADKTVTWSTSDKKIATVDKNGIIKGISAGDVTITITTKDQKKTDTWDLTVQAISVEGVSIDDIDVFVKQKVTITPVFTPAEPSNKNVTWVMDDTSIATIDKNGVITGVSPGETTLTVTTADGGFEDTCTVTVDAVHPESISLDKTELTLEAGKTVTLKATVLPSDAFNKAVIWSSDDEAIAIVDGNGKVTALSKGDTTITATTVDGGLAATCELTVEDVAIKSVKLPKTLVVETGKTQQLVPTISPAIKPTIEWESSDDDVATVDEDGNVTGGDEPGTAVITVKVSNTKTTTPLTAQCTVTVKAIAVQSIELDETAKTMYTGDEFDLEATVKPTDAFNKDVVWASSKPAVATVDPDGHVVAVSKGTANITATAADGSKKVAKCVITVVPVAVESVDIDKDSVNLALNNTCTLDYTVYPTNAADKTVTWTSGNKKVASVDKNGVIKGLSEGDAVITVTTKDGKFTDSCTVHVSAIALDSITMEDELTVMVKQKLTLTPTFDPVEASYKDVVWSVDDKSIATVDKSGNVTGVKAGTTTVTVTSKNYPTISATCEVTVIPAKIIEITLSKDYVVLDINKTATLKATFQMSNAENKNLVWEVVDDEIATVDQKGKITALAEGKTTVRVTSQESYGSEDPVFDECTVYVKTVSVKSVTLNVTKLSMTVGGEYALEATVGPENATWKDVIWSSSDSSVVSVDEDGNLTALKAGTAKITVLTLDGNKKATCTVTVS